MRKQRAYDDMEIVVSGELIPTESERSSKRKIGLPALPIRCVHRSRLIDKLNSGLDNGSQLTLICAPAGYGKTTTVIEWMSQADRMVAWVDAGLAGSSPKRFWSEVVAALRSTHESLDKGLLSLLQRSTLSIEPAKVVTEVLRQLADLSPQPLFLVVDGYIASKAIDATLSQFVDHLPPQLHLVMTTRTEVELRLSRLRLSRKVTEIGSQELSFSEQETNKLLVEIMGLDLSPAQVEELQSKTEGWIAALLLAASGLERQSDSSKEAFITYLSGGARYVLEYLQQEALRNLPGDSYQFLREVSILQRMSASLCDAVTGRQDSRHMLDRLERTNLFVQPLDDDRVWYRCHGLVARALRTEFEQSDPERFRESHIKASDWFVSHGYADEAFRYALDALDYERCADIIEHEYYMRWRCGEIAVISEWLDYLPEEVVSKRPFLTLTSASILMADCQLDLAKLRITRAEKALSIDDGTPKFYDSWLRSWALVLRAGISQMRGDYSGALELIRQSTASPYTDPTVLVSAYHLGGTIESRIGHTEDAKGYLSRTILLAEEMGDMYSVISAYHVLSDVLILDGRLREAHDLCLKALKSSEESRTAAPYRWRIGVSLARVCYEWDQLEDAKRAVSMSSSDSTMEPIKAAAMSELFWLQTRLGLLPPDTASLWEDSKLLLDPGSLDTVRANQLLILLWQGRMMDADALARRLHLDELKPSASNAPLLLAYVRLLMSRRYLGKAINLLREMADRINADRHEGLHIQMLLLQSLAIYLSGDSERALVPLQHMLVMAEPEGYVRSFVDLGKPMEKLLRLSFDRGLSTDYVARLLEAFERQVQPASIGLQQDSSDVILEPLSRRELETLRFLAEGYSYQQIADKLCVSLSTIGSHTQSIYRKLNVHSSPRAVAKAAKLGLLGPTGLSSEPSFQRSEAHNS